jgi:hypothetical protein
MPWRAKSPPSSACRRHNPLALRSPLRRGDNASEPVRAPGERVFVITPLAAKAIQENAFIYGELASGAAYVESDPIGLRGGVNTYGYVAQNPVSLVDPNGLEPTPLPPQRQRRRNCTSDERTTCEQMCAPRGVESCMVNQTWRIKTIKGGLAGWGWHDGPMSCSCKEGNACQRNPKTCAVAAGVAICLLLATPWPDDVLIPGVAAGGGLMATQ